MMPKPEYMEAVITKASSYLEQIAVLDNSELILDSLFARDTAEELTSELLLVFLDAIIHKVMKEDPENKVRLGYLHDLRVEVFDNA